MANTHKDIYILGIHDGHNAGASLVKNGEVVAAISEERLTNTKNQAGTPVFSIAKVFDIAGINPEDVSLVAVASYYRVVFDTQHEKESLIFRLHTATAPYLHGKKFNELAVKLLSRITDRSGIPEILKTAGIANSTPIHYIEHHTAHAATAFYSRPWKDKTLVLTLDGMGDGISSTVNIGEGSKMKRIASSTSFDSLGANVYSEITRFLGMKRNEHEYKVMGLAPYGNPSQTIDVFRKVIRFHPDHPLEFKNQTHYYMESLEPYFEKSLRYKRFDSVAAGVQKFFEEMVTEWVKRAIRRTGINKIACSGGSFLNVKTNMLLRQLPLVKDVFIYPAADDSGLAVGAALEGYVRYCEDNNLKPTVSQIKSVYYGQEYNSDVIEEIIKRKKLSRQAGKYYPDEAAEYLADGKILGLFWGRDEWGPRALGNRSIIADPRRSDIPSRLNHAIKHRDFWMPFAPAILSEDQEKYLKHPEFAPYMIEAFETTKHASDIIATTHPADHTVRPMTVNDWNVPWQTLIRAFKKKTGVGALLNTSFNLHGYPLVGTLEQALWTFQNSGLDGLILGDWLIMK